MADQIIFYIKTILLTEALTHAVRSWGILATPRDYVTQHIDFIRRLLLCFECTSVWITAAVVAYVYFVDFWPLTFIIITARLATIAHIVIDWMDAARASAINKI